MRTNEELAGDLERDFVHSIWMGFGYMFGWAGYEMVNVPDWSWGVYLEGLWRGALFTFVLFIYHILVFKVALLWRRYYENRTL